MKELNVKNVQVIDRPFYVFNNHIIQAEPKQITVNSKGMKFYTFELLQGGDYTIPECWVYRTESEARKHFK